jgi:hypothetical protein
MQWVATKVVFCISRIAAFGAGFLRLVLAIGPWPFDEKSNWQIAIGNWPNLSSHAPRRELLARR